MAAAVLEQAPTPEPLITSDSDPSWGGFESIGVQRIAERDQTSTPWTFFQILVGGNLALGVMVFGWISITLGLGTVDALTSILAGVVVGIPLVWVLVLIGSRTATNNSTASGAHFGVQGRLVGSGLTLAFALAYAAIAVWTSGDALVGAAHRLIGTPTGDGALAVGYALIAIEIATVALYGHGTVVALQKIVVPVVGDFEAIVLAGGSTVPRDLRVPGRELAGIHFAMDYLTLQNRATEGDTVDLISARDKHVIIIGGGDTGSDCTGTSNRHGARSVTQFELLPKPPDLGYFHRAAERARDVRPQFFQRLVHVYQRPVSALDRSGAANFLL